MLSRNKRLIKMTPNTNLGLFLKNLTFDCKLQTAIINKTIITKKTTLTNNFVPIYSIKLITIMGRSVSRCPRLF